MSRDIDLYRDSQCDISVTIGGWGARFFLSELGPDGKRVISRETAIMSDLVTIEKLDTLIKKLTEQRVYLIDDNEEETTPS